MRTVILGPRPLEVEALIAHRRRLGLDRFDEVWEGEYHMAPALTTKHGWLDDEVAAALRPLARMAGLRATGPVNIGGPDDFRVPDRALHRVEPRGVWLPTAALEVEIESPDDETWEKLGFYAAHEVDEVLIVSGSDRSLTWLSRDHAGRRYDVISCSALLGPESGRLGDTIDWPTPS